MSRLWNTNTHTHSHKATCSCRTKRFKENDIGLPQAGERPAGRGESGEALSWCFINWFLQLCRFQVPPLSFSLSLSRSETLFLAAWWNIRGAHFFGLTCPSSFFLSPKEAGRLSSVQLLHLTVEVFVGEQPRGLGHTWPFYSGARPNIHGTDLADFYLLPFFLWKNEQFLLFRPPGVGRIHTHLAVPAEEPTHSPQEETHGLLLHTHLTQRR